MNAFKITSEKGQVQKGLIMIVLRFTFNKAIEPSDFWNKAAEIFNDELGTSALFTNAPKFRKDLTPNFFWNSYPKTEMYHREGNEVIGAFFIEQSDPGVSIYDEITALTNEVNLVAEKTNCIVNQLDLRSMYQH
jgi:hypothetical protein